VGLIQDMFGGFQDLEWILHHRFVISIGIDWSFCDQEEEK